MTYDEMLNTLDSFEAYLSFSTHKLEDDFWLKVQAENTLQAYERYLSTLPKGVHKQKALSCINEIKIQEQEKTEQQRKKAQQQRELEDQQKRDQAIAEDKQAYEKAKDTNTISSYEYYLKNYPSGIYYKEATLNFNKLKEEKEAIDKVNEDRMRALEILDEKKDETSRKFHKHKEAVPYIIFGLFVGIILIGFFYNYPDGTFITLVAATSIFMLALMSDNDAFGFIIFLLVLQILMFIFLYYWLQIIYLLVFGGLFICLIGYLVYILKLYKDMKENSYS